MQFLFLKVRAHTAAIEPEACLSPKHKAQAVALLCRYFIESETGVKVKPEIVRDVLELVKTG
ncbi:MAG: hypothetical protein ACOWWM_19380 [Desulfobacterales bacterium]